MKTSLTFFLFMGILASFQSGATAKKGFGPGEQDWGWYEVRKGAHLFYWLFYTQDPTVNSFYDKPLVIFLYGGPGVSSTGFANFMEVGPLHVNNSQRSTSWASHVNLMFIDNPVGVGYSYLEPGENFTTTNQDIGAEMLQFLIKFYEDHPKFNSVPLYIFGESYGGKMVVEIAKQLHGAIKAEKLKANFKGIGLGAPWISPFDSVESWAPIALHIGLVDQQGYERFTNVLEKFKEAITQGQTDNITIFTGLLSFINKEAGNVNFYNYLDAVGPISNIGENKPSSGNNNTLCNSTDGSTNDTKCNSTSTGIMSGEINQLMNGNVKEFLKLPNDKSFKNYNEGVRFALNKDFFKPVTNVVEEILNNTDLQIVVYSGQLDLIVSSLGTLRWVDRLNWPGKSMWQSAKREPFIIDNIIEGYVKSAGNLHFYWINRAGHMVPIYNAKAAKELLRRVTKYDITA